MERRGFLPPQQTNHHRGDELSFRRIRLIHDRLHELIEIRADLHWILVSSPFVACLCGPKQLPFPTIPSPSPPRHLLVSRERHRNPLPSGLARYFCTKCASEAQCGIRQEVKPLGWDQPLGHGQAGKFYPFPARIRSHSVRNSAHPGIMMSDVGEDHPETGASL